MKNSLILMLLLVMSCYSGYSQKSYESEWKQVESFSRKGLPQSALKIVDSIYTVSKAENNAPQFLKAALYQIKLRADYQEDYMESSISQVKNEIRTSQEPVKQILHSIEAELYWRYYMGNRYKFFGRTQVTNPDTNDIKTWDIRMLNNVITSNYMASLGDEEQLQKISLDPYDPILETETGSKTFRPTLYDFLAFRVLDFFMNEETDVTQTATCFSIDQEKYFAPAREFIAVNDLLLSSCFNRQLEALHIFQGLLRFHLNDKEPAALIDADLARLKYVNQKSVLPNNHDLYLKALQNLQNTYPDNLHTADVAYEIALEYQKTGSSYVPGQTDSCRWESKKAKETCENTISKYPGSNGAQNCALLLKEITETTVGYTLNYANVPDQPFLSLLSYKNIKTVYFRIIKTNPEDDRALRQKEREEALVEKYKAMTPLKQWTLTLPDEGDFQQHQAQVKIPALSKGYYIILASDNADFLIDNKSVAYASCWVTGISFFSRNSQESNDLEAYVLDRDKGTALKGVKAQAYSREYDYPSRSYMNKPVGTYTTDESGFVSIPSQSNVSKSFYLEFSTDDDLFITENYFYVYPLAKNEQSRTVTYFFTDRSIYRPGQTVYFKGIVLEKTGEKTQIKPDFTSVVTFYDVNGQKVSELAMTTNAYGSFNGTFTAPTGGLTGEMYIRNESGSVDFSVEEYKRPRFKVDVDPLEGSYKLNELVNVTGKAVNYSGAAVDQAQVSYRVVRTARFPVWRSWRSWFPSVPETEITSGTIVTSASGAFTLSFKAIPDLKIDKKYQPVFNYKIMIDVTDMTGEVHSAEESVSVGYQALLVNVDIPDEVNIKENKDYKLTATNLNGRPLETQVKVSVYPLDAPSRLIHERSWGKPDVFLMSKEEFLKDFPYDLYNNENEPDTWNKKALLFEKTFNSAKDSVFKFENPAQLSEGQYVMILEALDTYGNKVETKKYFTAFNPAQSQMTLNNPFWQVMLKDSGEPGDTASLIVGTAEKNARILYEIENDGKIISKEWLALNQGKTMLKIPIREEYRGNFFINLTMVKGNRSYAVNERISVPYTDKQLKITTETFRDKMTPGKDEEWKLRITGMNGEKVAAELLASMYDASLDAFRDHSWSFDLYPYRFDGSGWGIGNAFSQTNSNPVSKKPVDLQGPIMQNYDRLNWFGFNYYGGGGPRMGGAMMMKNAMPAMDGGIIKPDEQVAEESDKSTAPAIKADVEPEKTMPKVPDQPVRKNFNETAFFFPALMTDANGDVILKFTVPESLTAWKLMALAYTKDLKTGTLIKDAVSRKELMVMSNAPRFFREGDQIFFSAKLTSLSDQKLSGQVTAEFFDALTMQPINDILGNKSITKNFSVEKGKSQAFSWDITIPQGLEAIVCRVKASSGEFSDGEEIVVPVLPNRMLVTETLPLPINGKGTKSFKFNKLNESSKSTSIKSYRLTLEFTSNPAWYAVQALPYLTENQHESADALFERYYANTLASWIANSNPKIKQVFESWKNLTPDALLSNLEKNQELKAVLLNETPWVMEARNETERKKRIALLFDLNRMASEQQAALSKLTQMQSSNGGWPWFEGMPDNRHVTQEIVTGIGKLHNLNVLDLKREPELISAVQRAFNYLGDRLKEDYDDLIKYQKDKMDEDHLGAIQVEYLYAYSFLDDFVRINPNHREAFDYYKGQAAKYWTDQNKYLQGMIALALYRFNVPDVPMAIINSLKENSLESDELGMYWREPEGYYWYEAPVERQAMLIEAFAEVAKDDLSVEKMKIWLLKQKQTQDWKTSQATADAVYVLLLRGTDLLASDQLVEVTLGDEKIDPLTMDGVQVQAGTGYFQVSKTAKEITPAMGNVKVVKKDEGIAWGALYWQYYENLDKITPAATPLSLERELYVEKNTAAGPVLEPVLDNKILKVGDRVVARVIIRVDRDMEYVCMKDMRAAAFEPIESLSGYRYQGGLGYYESIRDASMNFYFDYLRKGTYVFEYKLNVTQKGEFSNGITSIQCLYAPEFAAHSEGVRVTVE
jgi:hypothetical protein